MKIVPSKTITILSPLSKDEAFEAITERVHKVSRLSAFSTRNSSFFSYEGFIDGDEIVFRRILKRGRNSFIPKVIATTHAAKNGSVITLYARPQKFTTIFTRFITAFTVFLLVTGIYITIEASQKLDIVVMPLSTLLLLIFSQTLIHTAFKAEVYKMEKDVRQLVKNTEPPSGNQQLNHIIEKLYTFF